MQQASFALTSIGVMEQGQRFFLFLRPFTGPQTKGAFMPLGAFQGKFLIEEERVRSQENEEEFLEQSAGTFRALLE